MSENSHSSGSQYRNLVQNAHQNLCVVSGIRLLPSLVCCNILIFIRNSIKALTSVKSPWCLIKDQFRYHFLTVPLYFTPCFSSFQAVHHSVCWEEIKPTKGAFNFIYNIRCIKCMKRITEHFFNKNHSYCIKLLMKSIALRNTKSFIKNAFCYKVGVRIDYLI